MNYVYTDKIANTMLNLAFALTICNNFQSLIDNGTKFIILHIGTAKNTEHN